MHRKNNQYHKKFGQHLLHDTEIARKIVDNLTLTHPSIIEAGPGKGALTHWLLQSAPKTPIYLIEIDPRFTLYLKKNYKRKDLYIIQADFLKFPLEEIQHRSSAFISNLPYNISSQILFKILHHRVRFQEMVCVVQQEVAERIVAQPNKKTYGILSILLQAFYDVRYCFHIPLSASTPPPKVDSGVVHFLRKRTQLPCNEALFFTIVKTTFQQRRKMLRNTLKTIQPSLQNIPDKFLQKRPENLSIDDFITLTQILSNQSTNE